MEGDPSNENDYKRALDERVKEYMKFFMKMKEILGEEEEREIRAFLDNPVGNGNLKKDTLIFAI